ncbi:MAG: signal peptide peptidase SppA [Bacteroidales bacterium]|nr:signal peptide peptidase SppA [Bacteroidales bacterium]
MKQFFKFMFASMLGFFLTFLIIFFIFIGIFASILSFAEKDLIKVHENTVLHIKLNNPIPERTSKNPFENINFLTLKLHDVPGLNDILKNLKKAEIDKNIKGIYLDLSNVPSGIATIEEVRNALLEFKKTGKFIICYGEFYSQSAYYLATAADKIYLNPEGMLLFKGLNAQLMFLKGTLDKLDIEAQIIRHGKYKSAAEPFMFDKMSKANKEQMQEFVNSIWNNIITAISESRNIDLYNLNLIADNLDLQNAYDALKYNFVDKLMYKDELLAELRTKLGIGENDKISSMTLLKYTHAQGKAVKKKRSKNKIAIVYANGEIVMGKGDEHTIGSECISKAIRKARLDNNVKAIVFRVNSPGGDALASDIIWREVVLAKKEKPVIVSMGNVAASGGYWISCAADKIIADPTTITGSIGVFGIIPNFKNFFKDKLGITFDNVKTNKNADFIPVVRPLTSYQKSVIQNEVERIYQTFLEHVSKGRNLTIAQVDSIGQGRIWSGVDAKRIGLIDDLGGLEKAVDLAAEMAELTEYRTIELPIIKDLFQQLFEDLISGAKISYIKKELGENYTYYKYLKSISEMDGVQARLPFEIIIE